MTDVFPGATLIRCPACGEHKPIERFSRDKKRLSGRYVYCKPCTHAKRMVWQARNRSKVNAQQKAWYWRNHKRGLEIAARWRDGHRDAMRAYDAKRRKDQPETFRDYSKLRRARKRGAPAEKVASIVVIRLSHGLCGICGHRIESDERWHVDHIVPLSRGGTHTYSNTQAAHAPCNLRKGAWVA